MSEQELAILRFIFVYTIGCLFCMTEMVAHLNFYDRHFKEYAEKHKVKHFRFERAITYSAYCLFWPLNLIYDIYFKYFYEGGDDD